MGYLQHLIGKYKRSHIFAKLEFSGAPVIIIIVRGVEEFRAITQNIYSIQIPFLLTRLRCQTMPRYTGIQYKLIVLSLRMQPVLKSLR